MSPDSRRRKLKSPYEKWHRKLREFAGNVELDPVLAARNEFLRLENMPWQLRNACGSASVNGRISP